MADSKRMGTEELKALVTREISLARSDSAERRKKLTKALEYYQGTMSDLAAEEGRSSVVSRDLADTMGWMQPGIIRVFTASNRMALCEPVGDEDDRFAEQATDGINYTFWKENDGYRCVYDATWDSLINGNGIVKVYWDDTPGDEISYHTGLPEDVYTELVADDDVEVLAHDESVEVISTEDGQQVPVTLHRVKIKRTKRGGKTCVEAIPPEDYGKDSDSKTCKSARFQYHRSDKTRSQLIEMGFDRAVVDGLSVAVGNNSSEDNARRDNVPRIEGSDTSTEIVDYYECFMLVDVDDDGIAEMCRIHYAGNEGGGEVLDWEVWEDEPVFYEIPCSPMPHRWEAQSIFDETEDVQKIKTVMLRQANDNTYATNNPTRFVEGELLNPEELFAPGFGGAVFGKLGSKVTPLVVPFVANHAYDALNYQDQVIQRRTGVSRQTMALDPEALTNQSATANQNEKDASYSQIELVARNMAELGWAPVFKAILRTEVKHQDAERTIRMNRKAVRIDPRWWNTDMDVTIDVGLGTGSRDRDAMMLQNVLGNQVMISDRLAQAFPEKALEMLPYVRKTLVKQGEAVGIRNIDSFYPEVTDQDIEKGKAELAKRAQQPPLEVQLKQMDVQATAQTEELKAKGNAAKEQLQLEADMQTGEMDRQSEMMLEAQRQQIQREEIASRERIEMAKLAQDRELEIMRMSVVDEETDDAGPPSADGKATGPKKKTKRRIIETMGPRQNEILAGFGALSNAVQQLALRMERVEATSGAEVQIIRGPDGRATGARKVLN